MIPRTLAALLLGALLAIGGCGLTTAGFAPAPTGATADVGAVAPVEPSETAAVLAQLPAKGRAPTTGYDRDQFPHWSDLDRDGCDTRAETLERDARPGTVLRDSDGCVNGATIDGPYSGRVIVEEQGRGSDVDIDHVVALSDAWQKGAQQLTPERREALANDPLNLLAVDDTLNRQKSDGDAATWLPPNEAYRCDYVAVQVAVKAKYGLWVTAPERDAIARVLTGCPGLALPVGGVR